ncbi:MAG: hypothetical protein M4579_002699 [Chaenotheca gracillima]|nr:MAG: hypothetical protein M4579_002699 [Chaenotheca gracillima]
MEGLKIALEEEVPSCGNTFWEFKDAVSSNRLRRIVQYSSNTHYSDIQITPQWHQWLRHTRFDPPSIVEQEADVERQISIKQLAQQADERWASKPSFLDKPKEQPRPATQVKDPGGYAQDNTDETKGVRNAVGSTEEKLESQGTSKKENPWDNHKRGGPSEGWQPQAWDPNSGGSGR